MSTELQTSQRFVSPKERRDFLGLAATWSAVSALGVALVGALRLPMPSVFPESNPRMKLGPIKQFLAAEVTPQPENRLWVFSDASGLYAISSVCTHLGCIVKPTPDGFECPCHGSKFSGDGAVLSGPAPQPLPWLKIEVSGATCTVDAGATVPVGTKVNS